MRIEPKFYNKDGITLTRYSLACGYVQRQVAHGRYRELYMEHEHFHVKSGTVADGYELWETFEGDELKAARKCYAGIDLRPWETARFLYLSDAKKYQRQLQRQGYQTRLIKHAGIENPYCDVKFFI